MPFRHMPVGVLRRLTQSHRPVVRDVDLWFTEQDATVQSSVGPTSS